MRPLRLAAVVLCFGLVIGVHAQMLSIDDWAQDAPQNAPTASWYGNTGLIYTPSAVIGTPTKVSGGFHRVELDAANQEVYNANVAITADLEFGVARIKNVRPRGVLNASLTDETVISGKYALDLQKWIGVEGTPQLAVGVWDAADQLNRTYYLVLTQPLATGAEGLASTVMLHVGYGDTEHGIGAMNGFFAGLEFSPFEDAVVQIEYDADDFNADVRYYVTEWLSLDAGLIDGDFAWGASARTAF